MCSCVSHKNARTSLGEREKNTVEKKKIRSIFLSLVLLLFVFYYSPIKEWWDDAKHEPSSFHHFESAFRVYFILNFFYTKSFFAMFDMICLIYGEREEKKLFFIIFDVREWERDVNLFFFMHAYVSFRLSWQKKGFFWLEKKAEEERRIIQLGKNKYKVYMRQKKETSIQQQNPFTRRIISVPMAK